MEGCKIMLTAECRFCCNQRKAYAHCSTRYACQLRVEPLRNGAFQSEAMVNYCVTAIVGSSVGSRGHFWW